MEALNTLERPKRLGLGGGRRMPPSEETMFCSRPITVDHVVINYITGKIMTPRGGGESSAIPSTVRIHLH
jgi:hypothetical protein